MKKNCIAVFAKTPGLSALKTRLAKDIGKQKAEDIFALCVDEVQKTLQEFTAHNPSWEVTWALAEEAAAEHSFWQNRPFRKLWTGDGGLGTRQANIYEKLRAEYETVALIGTDCPHLDMPVLDEVNMLLKKENTIFGPATDGGYYLFASSENISREIWESVPYSCEQTLQVFMHRLKNKPTLLKKLTDLDEISDISIILDEMNKDNTLSALLKKEEKLWSLKN